MRIRRFLLLAALPAVLSGCLERTTGAAMGCDPFLESFTEAVGESLPHSSGVRYVDVRTGVGTEVRTGLFVQLHWTGYLTDGTQFDSTCDSGGFQFVLGFGGFVPGFEPPLVGMRWNGIRRLIIPPHLGYGANPPADSGIPPNATLIFDVHLVDIR